MNENKLERFGFEFDSENHQKSILGRMAGLIGIKFKEEKLFKEKFPETPYFVNEIVMFWVDDYFKRKREDKYFISEIGKYTEDREEYIEYVLTEIGIKFRNIYIDFANNGDSKNFCFEFSVRLRDIFNFYLKSIGLSQQSFLINGSFNFANHNWVVVGHSDDISVLENNTIYDGTIDQFSNMGDLDVYKKMIISNLKFATVSQTSGLRDLYDWEGVYPAPEIYFREK